LVGGGISLSLTSIIILTLNNLAKTKKCLESIRTYTPEEYELIIVDNGSTDGTIPFLKQFPEIKLICNTENKGFAGGCNQALKIAKGEQFLLLNNDTIVSHKWLFNMLQALHSNSQVGLVGPLSNMTLHQQLYKMEYTNDEEYHRFALHQNIHNPGRWKSVPVLSGFCLLFKREVLGEIGLLDEQYNIGNFEDIDYCYRALKAGFKALVAGDTFVHHDGNSSFKKNGMNILLISHENRNKFIRKWGINPEKLIFGSINDLGWTKDGNTDKARKRVMIFSHICYPTYITGAEKNLLFLLDELKNHYDCILVAPNEGHLTREAAKKGIEVIVFRYPMLWSIWQPSASLDVEFERLLSDRSMDILKSILHTKQPDLVISNSCINILPAVAAKGLGIPAAWWIQEVITQNAYTPKAVALIHRFADWILCLSNAVLNALKGTWEEAQSVLLYPSYRAEEMHPSTWKNERAVTRQNLGLRDSDILIGTISADIVPHKGLDHFIMMALELCKEIKQVHFLIVGNQTDRTFLQKCLQKISQSGYYDRFHFHAFEREIQKIYPAMDIVVIPSLIDEGLGLTGLEAMLYGIPVAAYRSGGLEEVVGCTGSDSFLANKGDYLQLKERVMKLIRNESLRKQTGEQNQLAACRVFGMDQFRERLNNFMTKANIKMDRIKLINNADGQVYPNGILMKGTSPTVFLLENGQKRPIVNEASFTYFKYRWDKIIQIDDDKLSLFPTGIPIDKDKSILPFAPQNMLAYGKNSAIYLINDGIKYPFSSYNIFQRLIYATDQIIHISDSILNSLPMGPPITDNVFMEHELINGKLFISPGGEFFYSDQHQLRKINSQRELFMFKWESKEAIALSESEYQVLPKGVKIQI
jgi:GT2 family glycosyltransferase